MVGNRGDAGVNVKDCVEVKVTAPRKPTDGIDRFPGIKGAGQPVLPGEQPWSSGVHGRHLVRSQHQPLRLERLMIWAWLVPPRCRIATTSGEARPGLSSIFNPE